MDRDLHYIRNPKCMEWDEQTLTAGQDLKRIPGRITNVEELEKAAGLLSTKTAR